MTFKLILNNGKQYLVTKNFKFRLSRILTDGSISWRCTKKDCSSWVKTDSKKSKLLSEKQEHEHGAQYNSTALPSSTPLPRTRAAPPATASVSVSPASTPATTPSAASTSVPSTPAASSSTAASPAVCTGSAATPSAPNTPITVSHSPTYFSELVSENTALKKELTDLKLQLQSVLDHSIESDQRLLQFTNEIFTTKPSTSTNSQSRPALIDQHSQTESASSDLLLPGKICTGCQIHEKEISKLMNTVRVLELEITALKQPHTSPAHAPQITVGNRYMALSDLNDEDTASFTVVSRKKKNAREKTTNKKQKHISSKKHDHDTKSKKHTKLKKTILPFKNVTVLGDSHSRNLSAIMRAQTAGHTNIIGVCKPGAGLLHIAPSHAPPENHCYVLVVGTNDLAAGRQDIVFQHMEEVIKSCRISSNLLVSPLPPRYDLPPDSPIHESIALANSYVSELCERYEGVAMMDISVLGREHFTPHGLHLTTTGKSLLAGLIVKELTGLPRRHFRTTAPTAPPRSPSASPTPTAQHHSYAEAVISRPAGQSTDLRPKERQSDLKYESGFLGTPSTSAGLN
ncbi:hypothetical protein J6590_068265 [Homalodisca vitripennis]|nr:hypothetical protein J6590_068265 [Homalodisca vitripennis]